MNQKAVQFRDKQHLREAEKSEALFLKQLFAKHNEQLVRELEENNDEFMPLSHPTDD